MEQAVCPRVRGSPRCSVSESNATILFRAGIEMHKRMKEERREIESIHDNICNGTRRNELVSGVSGWTEQV